MRWPPFAITFPPTRAYKLDVLANGLEMQFYTWVMISQFYPKQVLILSCQVYLDFCGRSWSLLVPPICFCQTNWKARLYVNQCHKPRLRFFQSEWRLLQSSKIAFAKVQMQIHAFTS